MGRRGASYVNWFCQKSGRACRRGVWMSGTHHRGAGLLVVVFVYFIFFGVVPSVRVGVPLFKGRQPSQNGQCRLSGTPSSCVCSTTSTAIRSDVAQVSGTIPPV